MKILSFDCAIKSLALCHVEFKSINEMLKNCIKLCNEHEGNLLDLLYKLLSILHFTKFISYSVNDILSGKKEKSINEVNKIRKLNNFIDNINITDVDLVLIEHQPNLINTKSSMVEHVLVTKYINRNVVTIKPQLKNTINLIGSLEEFKQIYKKKNKYSLRKKHAVETFLYFINTFGYNYILNNISKYYYDDIADAFLQSLFYFIKFIN